MGTVTAPVPVLVTVTTPFGSVAVTVPAVWAAAQAACSAEDLGLGDVGHLA